MLLGVQEGPGGATNGLRLILQPMGNLPYSTSSKNTMWWASNQGRAPIETELGTGGIMATGGIMTTTGAWTYHSRAVSYKMHSVCQFSNCANAEETCPCCIIMQDATIPVLQRNILLYQQVLLRDAQHLVRVISKRALSEK